MCIPLLFSGLVFLSTSFTGHSQTQTAARMEHGKIVHNAGSATVQTNDSRALAQAVVAIRQEYGWLVDYEDPIYSGSELVDARTLYKDWFLAHPELKSGLVAAGGPFVSTYAESFDPAKSTDADRAAVLMQVLSDYAKSGYAGHFVLQQLGPGRLAVIGQNSGNSILSTTISVDFDHTPAFDALEKMLHIVGTKTAYRVGLGFVPNNPLMHCIITSSFTDKTARFILQSVLDSCSLPLTWQALYGVTGNFYLVNLDSAVRVFTDAEGNRRYGPPPPLKSVPRCPVAVVESPAPDHCSPTPPR